MIDRNQQCSAAGVYAAVRPLGVIFDSSGRRDRGAGADPAVLG